MTPFVPPHNSGVAQWPDSSSCTPFPAANRKKWGRRRSFVELTNKFCARTGSALMARWLKVLPLSCRTTCSVEQDFSCITGLTTHSCKAPPPSLKAKIPVSVTIIPPLDSESNLIVSPGTTSLQGWYLRVLISFSAIATHPVWWSACPMHVEQKLVMRMK
jgi:hypothetical protein